MKRNYYPEASWEKLKQDVVSGALTLRQAAEKHSIPYKSAESRYYREGWKKDMRENLQIVKEIAGKTLQERQQELGERAGQFLLETTTVLQDLLRDFRAKRGQTASLADFETYLSCFSSLVKNGQMLYGLDQGALAGTTVNVAVGFSGISNLHIEGDEAIEEPEAGQPVSVSQLQ